MKQSGRCPKCKGLRIGTYLTGPIEYKYREINYLCADCGYSEMYITDPAAKIEDLQGAGAFRDFRWVHSTQGPHR